MNYADARMRIFTGDIIAVREKHGIFSFLTRFFTRSAYNHVGIAVWWNNGLWMAELNGGRNHLIPLSQLENIPFDVYHCPIDDREAVETAISESLRERIDYGFAALAVIGLLNFFRIKVFIHARQILVCTGYCVKVLEAAGWPEHSRLISPQELTEELRYKLSVRPY